MVKRGSWRQREEDRKTGQFGPYYDLAGAGLDKHRRAARNGLAELSAADRRAYAEAVEKVVLAKQRSSLLGAGTPVSRCPCASGTWLSDGAEISAAVRAQHRAALQASAAEERRNRTAAQWESLYAEAMAEKRGQGVEQQRAA